MRRIGVFFIVLLTLAAAPADAQRLLGTTGAGSGTSTLVELDPSTGSLAATIGDVGHLVNGMAWDATTGTLYATTSTNDVTFPDGLITINPATAAATTIGTGAGFGSVLLPAVNSTGDLYGWWDPSQDDLIIFDKVTGVATRVGESGISTATHGLAFDASDVLYLVNYDTEVYTINTTTGAATSVGSISSVAHHGKFDPTTGLYWGINTEGSGGPRNLVVANLTTFTVVNTLPTVDGLHTLVWAEGTFVAPNAPVPAVSPWGAGLMALLVLVCGALVLRRFV